VRLQRRGHFVGRLKALLGIFGQHAIDDAFQVGRNIQTERRNLDGLLFQVGAELLDRRAAGKGRQTGQQVVQGAAQAVDGAAATSRGF